MNYKEFTKKSYGLEAKEVPPKPMTYSDVKEQLEEGILSKAIANKLILRKIKSIKWDDLAKMIKNGLLDGVDNIDDLDTKALHVALRNVNIKIKEEIEEDIRVSDPTGKKKAYAKSYADIYKDTHRGAPDIKNEKPGEFTLSGKDEKLVADLVRDK